MKRSRRELSINMDMEWFIFKSIQITLFTFISKTGTWEPKTGIIFFTSLNIIITVV